MEALRDLKKQMDKTKEEMRKIGKEALTSEFNKVFDGWPEIEGIKWTQYTPYFNDGEPCIFRVNNVYVKTENDFGGDDDDGWLEEYDFPSDLGVQPARTWMKNLNKSLELCEEILQSIFGDHVQVTIWRGKTEAEVESYDHD